MNENRPDDFAELHGDKFYMNLSNDDGAPGLIFLTLTAREDAVIHEDVPHFDIYQYLSLSEARRLRDELGTVIDRVAEYAKTHSLVEEEPSDGR